MYGSGASSFFLVNFRNKIDGQKFETPAANRFANFVQCDSSIAPSRVADDPLFFVYFKTFLSRTGTYKEIFGPWRDQNNWGVANGCSSTRHLGHFLEQFLPYW